MCLALACEIVENYFLNNLFLVCAVIISIFSYQKTTSLLLFTLSNICPKQILAFVLCGI